MSLVLDYVLQVRPDFEILLTVVGCFLDVLPLG